RPSDLVDRRELPQQAEPRVALAVVRVGRHPSLPARSRSPAPPAASPVRLSSGFPRRSASCPARSRASADSLRDRCAGALRVSAGPSTPLTSAPGTARGESAPCRSSCATDPHQDRRSRCFHAAPMARRRHREALRRRENVDQSGRVGRGLDGQHPAYPCAAAPLRPAPPPVVAQSLGVAPAALSNLAKASEAY